MEIESSGPPLGGFPKFNYELYQHELVTGDIFLLMSDGFVKDERKQKKFSGGIKEKNCLKEMKGLTAE